MLTYRSIAILLFFTCYTWGELPEEEFSWDSKEREKNINPSTWRAGNDGYFNDAGGQRLPSSPYRIPDQKAIIGFMFYYSIPKEAFESLNTKNVAATQAPHMPLPSWLIFDEKQKVLKGLPMEGDAGDLKILVLSTYTDREDTTSHLFHMLVIPDNVFDTKLDTNTVSRYNLDQSCTKTYPINTVLFLNVHMEMLQTQNILDIVKSLAAKIGIAVEQIQVGSAGQLISNFKNVCHFDDFSSKIESNQMAARFLSKKCDSACFYAEQIMKPVVGFNLGNAVVVHWALFQMESKTFVSNSTKPPIPWMISDDFLPDTGSGYNDNRQRFINPELLPPAFSLSVGEIMSYEIPRNLVQGESNFVLESQKSKDKSSFHQWIYIETSSNKMTTDATLQVITSNRNEGNHEFCLRPKSYPEECLSFKLFVRGRTPKENHRFLFVFDYDYDEFEDKVVLKQDLVRQLLRVAEPNGQHLSLSNVQFHQYDKNHAGKLLVSASFFNTDTSLCQIREDIELLYSQFVIKTANDTHLSHELLTYCRKYRPIDVTLQLFGPCSHFSTNGISAKHTRNSMISFDLSTILMIAFLGFIILVLIGISTIFGVMYSASRKREEGLYSNESFCGLRPKSTPVIFASEMENMSSRSSSPKQYASIYPTARVPASIAPSISPPRLVSATVAFDAYRTSSHSSGGGVSIAEALRNAQMEQKNAQAANAYDIPQASSPNTNTTTFAFRGRSPAEMLYQTQTLPRNLQPTHKIRNGNANFLQINRDHSPLPTYTFLKQLSDTPKTTGSC